MARPKKAWSKSRPKKPDMDPLLKQLLPELVADKRSNWALANVSGMSPSALKAWQEHRVRRPQAVSLQMVAKALGKKLVFTDI